MIRLSLSAVVANHRFLTIKFGVSLKKQHFLQIRPLNSGFVCLYIYIYYCKALPDFVFDRCYINKVYYYHESASKNEHDGTGVDKSRCHDSPNPHD